MSKICTFLREMVRGEKRCCTLPLFVLEAAPCLRALVLVQAVPVAHRERLSPSRRACSVLLCLRLLGPARVRGCERCRGGATRTRRRARTSRRLGGVLGVSMGDRHQERSRTQLGPASSRSHRRTQHRRDAPRSSVISPRLALGGRVEARLAQLAVVSPVVACRHEIDASSPPRCWDLAPATGDLWLDGLGLVMLGQLGHAARCPASVLHLVNEALIVDRSGAHEIATLLDVGC